LLADFLGALTVLAMIRRLLSGLEDEK